MEKELSEELGLTKNESKVYEVLVKHEKLSSTEVSSKSGVPYGRIYHVLDSLVKKGLATIIPDKTKKFSSTNPVSLIKLIEEKEKLLMRAKEKAKEMELTYESREKNPVIVGFGRKAFYEIAREMMKAKKYSYAVKFTGEFNPEWAEEFKKGSALDMKTLIRENDETKGNISDWIKYYKKIGKKNPLRVMENKMFLETYKNAEEVKEK
ncbi:TrmB family transcriptional regulator [Candidatus Pacearchaeota archaeon]|nr:TrmB family transcriptional regulator [Candidatus Pacearchaeota archaeon]